MSSPANKSLPDSLGSPADSVAPELGALPFAKQTKISLHAVWGLGVQLSGAQGAREAALIITEVADRLYGWDACKLDLYSPEQNRIYQVLIQDTINGQRQEFPPPYSHPEPSPLTKAVIDHGGRLILKDPTQRMPGAIPFGNSSRPSASAMFVPVRQRTAVCGVLSIQSYTPNAYTEDDLQGLQWLADHCGGALERIRIQEELAQRSAELESALARIAKLQNAVLRVCAWTKRINVDGEWVTVEQYLQETLGLQITHGMSGEAFEQMRQKLEGLNPGQ
jgi:GAF domain-containing protein